MKEIGEDTFDKLWRRSNPQHARVATPKVLRPLINRLGMIEQSATVGEQLFAFAGQNKAAS